MCPPKATTAQRCSNPRATASRNTRRSEPPMMRIVAICLLLAAIAPGALAADGDKACVSAKRKVEREQKSLSALDDSIAHDRRAREACVSRTVCARYDSAIADAERRSARLA